MSEVDIDGLLKKLKKSESEEKKDDLIKNNKKKEKEADLEFKEKVLKFFERELEKKFGNFFSSKEGREFIRSVLVEYLEKKQTIFEGILREEIISKVNSVVL